MNCVSKKAPQCLPPPPMKRCVSGSTGKKLTLGPIRVFSQSFLYHLQRHQVATAAIKHVKHKKLLLFESLRSLRYSPLIFSVHGLKHIENKFFLFVPSGKISGACGWVQFPLATVLAGYIARLGCRYTVSQTLRWKKRHSYHNKKG